MKQNSVSALSISRCTLTTIQKTLAKNFSGSEICGFLLGLHERDSLIISQVIVVRNGVTRPGGFSISRSESKYALRYARKLGLMVCAVFHTHLEKARLSMTDRRWIGQSDIPWVVFSHGVHDVPNGIQVDAYQSGTGKLLEIEFED